MNIRLAGLVLLISTATLASCGKQENNQKEAALGGSVAHASAPEIQVAPARKTYDGPFGLTGGIPVAELAGLGFKASESSPNVYIGQPPKPLDGVKDYYVFATPKSGVCRIRATFDVDLVNDSGDQLKSKTDQFAEMMSERYGKHSHKATFISKEVYRNNSQFWMMALREESAFYAYDWSNDKLEKPLPGDLVNIEVAANATSLTAGYVSIMYSYKNLDSCKDELKKKSAANL